MIPFMELRRIKVDADGAFGELYHVGERFAVTLEHTYEVSGKQVVKIQPGVYRCVRSWFIRGGYWTYEILVPGHDRILFHVGNVETDVDGCVAVGSSYGHLLGHEGILRSGNAFREFMRRAANAQEFNLKVV